MSIYMLQSVIRTQAITSAFCAIHACGLGEKSSWSAFWRKLANYRQEGEKLLRELSEQDKKINVIIDEGLRGM